MQAVLTAPDQVSATGTTPEAVGLVIGALGLVVYEMRLEQSNLEDVIFSVTAKEGSPVMNRLVRTELLKQRTTRAFATAVAAVPVVAGLVILASFSAAGKQGNEPLGPDHLLQALAVVAWRRCQR